MKIRLETYQQQMLALAGIHIDTAQEYSEHEVFEFLDRVYDIEVQYAQDADANLESKRLARKYAAIADTIQHQIPED